MSPSVTLPTSTHSWIVQNHAEDSIPLSGPSAIFALHITPLPSPLPADSLLVQTLYVSNDPVQRLWVHKGSSVQQRDMYVLPIGSVMRAWTISRVLRVGGAGESGGDGESDEKFRVGDLVTATTGWSKYVVLKKADARVVQELPTLSPSVWLGPFGLSGLTAYFGLLETCKIKESDTLVVSGAAGAIGNIVVQYAKNVLHVSHVVAIAGSDEKCAWLKSIGADETVNYKSATFSEDLVKATPDKVDVFFDNVGGPVLDEVLPRLKRYGRVIACGSVSAYMNSNSNILRNYVYLIINSLSIISFTVMDSAERFDEAVAALAAAVKEGKLRLEGAETVVDVSDRFEEVPKVWTGIFEGVNTGKLVTKFA